MHKSRKRAAFIWVTAVSAGLQFGGCGDDETMTTSTMNPPPVDAHVDGDAMTVVTMNPPVQTDASTDAGDAGQDGG